MRFYVIPKNFKFSYVTSKKILKVQRDRRTEIIMQNVHTSYKFVTKYTQASYLILILPIIIMQLLEYGLDLTKNTQRTLMKTTPRHVNHITTPIRDSTRGGALDSPVSLCLECVEISKRIKIWMVTYIQSLFRSSKWSRHNKNNA